ncbi:MAG TPA: DUF4340 domain-containing protein [Chthoniobacterales bacterium]
MKARTTLILLVVVVAIGAYIKFYESKRPNTEEAARQEKNVVNLSREKLDGIVIQNGDEKIELKRSGNKWRLEAPIKDQADSAAIDNLINDIENWRKTATIPAKEIEANKSQLNEYGLNKPKLRLKLIGADMPGEILFGKDAALEGQLYVRLGNSNNVFIAAQTLKNDVSKKAEDFRDRKLTELTTAQIARAVLKTPAGEIELIKKNEHWQIVKPLQARGDNQKIGDLLAQVTNARIQQFIADDRGDLHAYGLAEPRGSLTIFKQDDKQGQMLQIGGVPEKNKDQLYVRFLPRGEVYTLPKTLQEILNTVPNDLRDRHLVRIDTNILDRITIEGTGKPKLILARKGEAWTIASGNNQPANSDEAQRLINTLNNEQVVKFVEDTAANLAKYGLDKPPTQLTFSSFASENTAETAAGEHPFLTLSFGKAEGDQVYARVGEEPFVVAVKRSLLDDIWTDPLQWQERAIFKFKPEEIHRLSIVTDREQSLVRTGKNDWKWIVGNGPINKVNVQSLLNTLASLHAVRWITGPAATQALEKTQIAITFTTSPDDKTLHKVLIGGAAGNGMWSAKVDEREGAFAISNPDYTALRLPMAQSPAPSTAAAASPSVAPVSPSSTTAPTAPPAAAPMATP